MSETVGPGRMPARALAFIVLVALVCAPDAAAQDGFSNVDAGHPLRVGDAYPIAFREWELETSVRPELRDVGAARSRVSIGLKTGLYYDLEVGAEIEAEYRTGGGLATETGVHDIGIHVLYSAAHESSRMPGIGLRGEVLFPVGGSIGRRDWAFEAAGLATRSFGNLRLHALAGYRFTSERPTADTVPGGVCPVLTRGRSAAAHPGPPMAARSEQPMGASSSSCAAAPPFGPDGSVAIEHRDTWLAGLGFDVPFGGGARLILGDVFAQIPVYGGSPNVVAEAGTRMQLSNTWVLDLGAGTTVSDWDDGANVYFTVGLGHSFGVPWLVSVPPLPELSPRSSRVVNPSSWATPLLAHRRRLPQRRP